MKMALAGVILAALMSFFSIQWHRLHHPTELKSLPHIALWTLHGSQATTAEVDFDWPFSDCEDDSESDFGGLDHDGIVFVTGLFQPVQSVGLAPVLDHASLERIPDRAVHRPPETLSLA
jgi:hypothetical protein